MGGLRAAGLAVPGVGLGPGRWPAGATLPAAPPMPGPADREMTGCPPLGVPLAYRRAFGRPADVHEKLLRSSAGLVTGPTGSWSAGASARVGPTPVPATRARAAARPSRRRPIGRLTG